MSGKVLAAVLVDEQRLELDEFPRPAISSDDALLRVEACGICGADVELYDGHHASRGVQYPVIPGHEPVGIVEEIGAEAAARWGVRSGDRVIVEPIIPCGRCAPCRAGTTASCSGPNGLPAYYSGISTSVSPALWGGYAQYLYLHPDCRVRKISTDVPAEVASLFNPLGNGILWASFVPGTRIGETAVVFGSGQRGLASVVALAASGAGTIIVTDLAKARYKLDLARELGADHTLEVDREDVVERVAEITGGAMADVVIDTSSGATAPVVDALEVVRKGGRVVLGGLKGAKPIPGFVSDKIVLKRVQVLGAGAATGESFNAAIRLIESGRFPLEKLHSHDFGLADAETAIKTLAGGVEGQDPVHIAIRPWGVGA
jgi:threonine dehydrogenase-like Zn-dependent dehydrogenase